MTDFNITCLIVDDEPIAREILTNHLDKIPNVSIVGTCKNAIETIELLKETKVDLILLDINMPGMSGMSLAKSLDKNIKIVFTTAYREFAIEGFEVQAIDYLLKPISFDRLYKAVKVYSELEQVNVVNSKESQNYMFIRSERKMKRIDFDDILYIERFRDYLNIHLINQVIVSRENLDKLEEQLPSDSFLRVHRSFIVHTNKIDSFTNEHIEIERKVIPISRSYRPIVLKKLMN